MFPNVIAKRLAQKQSSGELGDVEVGVLVPQYMAGLMSALVKELMSACAKAAEETGSDTVRLRHVQLATICDERFSKLVNKGEER